MNLNRTIAGVGAAVLPAVTAALPKQKRHARRIIIRSVFEAIGGNTE